METFFHVFPDFLYGGILLPILYDNIPLHACSVPGKKIVLCGGSTNVWPWFHVAQGISYLSPTSYEYQCSSFFFFLSFLGFSYPFITSHIFSCFFFAFIFRFFRS